MEEELGTLRAMRLKKLKSMGMEGTVLEIVLLLTWDFAAVQLTIEVKVLAGKRKESRVQRRK